MNRSRQKEREADPDYWFESARHAFNDVVSVFLKRAKEAEAAELDHDCGHTFTVVVTMRGHSVGIADDPESKHSDANYEDTLLPVTVRAHDLRQAMLHVAATPLSEFFPQEVG